ncbi:chromosomal replication initiator protein DnaA [Streptococcus massiliensis]|uniref:Chromosomal replication initiator protein DnaA n=1 Tax=Streptococcus massiliensis TaxID=313439 RepID=A0A380KYT8_9STRE|nr:chromosomal replication initiator protein DnaA [Streptococcus massiliensis]SUN76297.1 chromosomal replication initiator protein DnaA [Streptococcus massiliensis]
MKQEDLFWNRFVDLAREKLNAAAFEHFVLEAKLLEIRQKKVTIFLDAEYKALYWESNIEGLIITAGFEIYSDKLDIEYVFELPASKTNRQNAPLNHTETSEPVAPFNRTHSTDTGLQARYVFDNFIQGAGNRMATGAALAVASNPGGYYNPLFIYGGPGLGKTHLLNAVGNEMLVNFPTSRVKYISTENFLNEFTKHIRLGEMENFREIYRNLDLLLIDDIQFLSFGTRKTETEKELFNIFNELYDNEKQIILTSDRSPAHLDNLDERLKSRFSWGLTTDITPYDFETRIAILKSKIEHLNYTFPRETLEYLAGQFVSNVRELEGALNDIKLLASIKNLKTITIDSAAEAIRARKQDVAHPVIIPIEKIQTEVGNFYGVSVKEMKGSRRVQNIVLARQVAMYLARELTDNSLPKIGKEFGGKDHTTVIHAYSKIKEAIEVDDTLRLEIENIKKKIN